MKLAIWGASGRMGQELIKAAKQVGADICECTRNKPCLDELSNCDAIIDFSTSQASKELVNYLLKLNKTQKIPALLVGTTGLDAEYFQLCERLQTQYFYSSNTSIGIAVLTQLCKNAAQILQNFDIEISETHHKHKKDAPSGTALSLAEAISTINGHKLVFNRSAERKDKEIGISSLRGGDIAGRHIVGFYGDGEWLELQHFASNRSIFATGAIKIASCLINQPAGSYSMQDFILNTVSSAK